MGIVKSRHTTNLVIKVVDFVAEISDVASQVFAVLFALGRLHRLASGTRTELLDLHIARADNGDVKFCSIYIPVDFCRHLVGTDTHTRLTALCPGLPG